MTVRHEGNRTIIHRDPPEPKTIHEKLRERNRYISTMKLSLQALQERVEFLEERLAEAQKDASRLDFLSGLQFSVYRVIESECAGYVYIMDVPNLKETSGKTLRTAIDAAMQAKP